MDSGGKWGWCQTQTPYKFICFLVKSSLGYHCRDQSQDNSFYFGYISHIDCSIDVGISSQRFCFLKTIFTDLDGLISSFIFDVLFESDSQGNDLNKEETAKL
jgi:hypothetical protein